MFQIKESASRQILKQLARHNIEGGGLRIALKAGGCSGFEYVFAWEPAPRENDHVFHGLEGARVFIDPRSYTLLAGTVLEYDTNLISRGFVFENPHAKSTCGCGLSFSADTNAAPAADEAARGHQ
jgi:iron-sulfur cluster assembly protein